MVFSGVRKVETSVFINTTFFISYLFMRCLSGYYVGIYCFFFLSCLSTRLLTCPNLLCLFLLASAEVLRHFTVLLKWYIHVTWHNRSSSSYFIRSLKQWRYCVPFWRRASTATTQAVGELCNPRLPRSQRERETNALCHGFHNQRICRRTISAHPAHDR